MQRSPDWRCSFESERGATLKNSRRKEVTLEGREAVRPFAPKKVQAPGPLVG